MNSKYEPKKKKNSTALKRRKKHTVIWSEEIYSGIRAYHRAKRDKKFF